MFGKKKETDIQENKQDNQVDSELGFDDGFSDFDSFDNTDTSDVTDTYDTSNTDAEYTEEPIVEQNEYEEQPQQYEAYSEPEVNQSSPVSTDKSNNSESAQDMVCYIIADKKMPGLINYFRECGIKVSNLFGDISEAKNFVLMQSIPARIVIIDSGQGKFTTTTMRAELIDMLGISDEQNKTTVFYTDSAIKVDTLRSLGKVAKTIDWIPYKSTPIVAASILSYHETYIYDMEDENDVIEDNKSILSLKGFALQTGKEEKLEISGFSSSSIYKNMVEAQGDELPGFVIDL